MRAPFPLLLLLLFLGCWWCSLAGGSQPPLTLSSRLIHRFSDEAREITRASRGMEGLFGAGWPSRGSMDYYRELVVSDLLRRRRRMLGARYQMLRPSEGSETMSLGNDFGWLHYTWITIGTPNISFLVALDAGSDLSWVPCDCIQCAPLSSQDTGLDKDLNMYSPAKSNTSKHISCNHELCVLGPTCKTPKQPCPYSISYYSENTSSSGLLIEDTLYLTSSDNNAIAQATVVIGCGRKQTGGYLDGIAPDGLLGLGLGNLSIPTFLAREGLVRNSFSICFRDDDSGRIFFGDQGSSTQQSIPFVPIDGKYVTYIIKVDGFCIGAKCLKETRMQALVDSGSSFTFIPDDVYKIVTSEFDRSMNRSRYSYEGSPWEYCYKASSMVMPKIPHVALMLAANKSFVINNPIFTYYGKEGELDGFCLALQSSDENLGTIGQNLMTGYRMVFDRENLKMGWSPSDCNDLGNSSGMSLTPPPHDKPENPLPSEQQKSPNSHAVSPAEAGRAPAHPSKASRNAFHFGVFLLLLLYPTYIIFGG